jgi:hypothetical protein
MNVRQITHRKGKRWMTAATHCVHGHEFTPANTYWNEEGWRTCRRCRADRAKVIRERKACQ